MLIYIYKIFSLGDLWSYDYSTETYVVSPDPDVAVLPLDPSKHRCLILASDGLWNMLTPEETVHMVMDLENQFEQKIINDPVRVGIYKFDVLIFFSISGR